MNGNEISEKWIKASIVGTTWAASEIVLGSFLHNLRIPFSSTLLTGIGIVILISASYIWKDKGLFWRAGLICALMKTMSPSAVIFGPMIAIFSQAALLEISVRIFQKTIFGFIIGAILAMTWNLFQKIMNLIIFYGSNIVEVYSDLLKYAQKQLNIQFDIVWLPILILLAIYSLSGLLSAIIGIRVGNKIRQQPALMKPRNQKNSYKPNNNQQKFNYSIFWLFLNLGLIITALMLLNYTSWIVWSVSVMTISAIWIVKYKRALRQLSKPKFWIFFVIITMTTAFVLNKMQSQSLMDGFLIGLQMNFRAATIILGFSVLGTELYNPVIRKFFMKTSMKQLPLALELSFKSLPMMIANLPESKAIIKNPVSIIYQIISQIEFRLNEIKSNLSKKTFIITGSIGEGKTTQLQKIIETLKKQEISIGGIISPRIVENKTTKGYDIVDIMTNERAAFLRKTGDEKLPGIGNYNILSEGLKKGNNAIKNSQNNQVIVIDEVGRLELNNKGWAENIEYLLNGSKSYLILSVRDRFIKQVINKWSLKDYKILDVSADDYIKNSKIIAKDINKLSNKA
ncbi:MAG: nucleoside-triphosphatase [Bacteroidales bacterium]